MDAPFKNMWSHEQLILWFSRKQGWHYLPPGTNDLTLPYNKGFRTEERVIVKGLELKKGL